MVGLNVIAGQRPCSRSSSDGGRSLADTLSLSRLRETRTDPGLVQPRPETTEPLALAASVKQGSVSGPDAR